MFLLLIFLENLLIDTEIGLDLLYQYNSVNGIQTRNFCQALTLEKIGKQWDKDGTINRLNSEIQSS